MSGIIRNVAASVAVAAALQAGCGKSAYYPSYVSPCVEAKQVREEAEKAQGDKKTMLEVKAQALEESCRNNMNERNKKQDRFHRPTLF